MDLRPASKINNDVWQKNIERPGHPGSGTGPNFRMFIIIIVENGGAGEFWAAPSEGAASAFRFDQSERDAPGAFFAFGLGPKSAPEVIRTLRMRQI